MSHILENGNLWGASMRQKQVISNLYGKSLQTELDMVTRGTYV
ncbi:hypothetical protein [Wolbachia pipientis]|nr:hypothetical protein [Wolbachia pipientis]